MSYQVRTAVFEGPFDLLLHLIAKRELDIYEVSLASITEEYLAHLKELQDLDLEVATEFLVVAATLVEMKAARLLPGPPAEDEEAAAERDLLVARLLEYRAFKDAAAAVKSLLAENEGYFPRTAGPGPEYAHLCPDLMARTSPAQLAALAVRVMTPKPVQVLDLSHVTPIRQTVGEAADQMRALLEARGRVTFRELSSDCRNRIDIVVRFLALLELVKRGECDVEQSEGFGEIVAVWLGRRAGEAIADEYDGAPAGASSPAGEADRVIVLEESIVVSPDDAAGVPPRVVTLGEEPPLRDERPRVIRLDEHDTASDSEKPWEVE